MILYFHRSGVNNNDNNFFNDLEFHNFVFYAHQNKGPFYYNDLHFLLIFSFVKAWVDEHKETRGEILLSLFYIFKELINEF